MPRVVSSRHVYSRSPARCLGHTDSPADKNSVRVEATVIGYKLIKCIGSLLGKCAIASPFKIAASLVYSSINVFGELKNRIS
ncbi:chemosensory receptor b [Plakobranchus ocellatus]|uniref:Chemosensory receptor b n=1 Tax=Plakobranchus ocellatus TaxID=259542 RepID=A0AAV4AN37_9GAST|nr:chemosensory receptor b [Plakobranchus ocellatus]